MCSYPGRKIGGREMLNGVKDYNEWQNVLTQEQRNYKLFEVLCNLDCRLKKIEGKSVFNKAAAFFGGIVGGIAVFLATAFKSIF